MQHNHEVSSETFKSYPECRQLCDDEVSFVKPLLELKVRPSMIVAKLREQTGKAVIAKDLHNLKRSTYGQDEAALLQDQLKHCKTAYGAKTLIVTDESKELQVLFIQTPHMQRAFRAFPEVLLLDATYRTNKLKMPLFVFVVQDGSGISHAVAYAFVACEQQHVVTRLLEVFVRENPAALDTKVVVVDKDFAEIAAIKTAFSSSPAVQLCEFHAVKAFRSAAGQVAKSADEREHLLHCFSKMLHASTPRKYEEAKAELEQIGNAEANKYFTKNWGSIPEMWVRHLCNREFNGGNNTTNRVESINGKIKNILSSSSKLHEALSEILKMSCSMHQEASHKAFLLKSCEFYSQQASEDLENHCAQLLTLYACTLVSEELRKIRDDPPEVRVISPETCHVASSCTDTWHEVSLEDQSCSCTTYSSMKLLCHHFLAVCVKVGKQPVLEKAVARRWFKAYQIQFLSTSNEDYIEAGCSQNPEISSMPGPSFERMNRNQRYNYAMRTLKAVADTLADCKADVFGARLAVLESLNASWLKRKDVSQRDSVTEDAPAVESAEVQDHQDLFSEHTDTVDSQDCEQLSSTSQQPSTSSSFDIRLPEVKTRRRPPKRILQRRQKRPRELDEGNPVPFKNLPEKAQASLLLCGVVEKSLCERVLGGECLIEESDVEVRPELLPSALLDCRVCLLKLKKYFTGDAWMLFTSSVATKKTTKLWMCGLCKKPDDGELKMVCCDHSLEWFHW